ITYLENNRDRMKYPDYRRAGLPVTTAWMESLVKEINLRVKGTEMFWNAPTGAEANLQVRAAALSDDNRLVTHLQTRRGSPLH
ncbi:MAG: LysR family transcriptional regulator, partial [Planctomycetaceae bacterium]